MSVNIQFILVVTEVGFRFTENANFNEEKTRYGRRGSNQRENPNTVHLYTIYIC